MDKQAKKKFPPLKIWVMLGVVLILILISLYFLERSSRKNEYSSRESYLKRQFASARGKRIILVLGSSLVQCGLDSSKQLEACIQERCGQSVSVLKVWKVASTISSLTDNMKLLEELKPDWVVVEANMLFYRPIQEPLLVACLRTFRGMISFKPLDKHYAPDEKPVSNRIENAHVDAGRDGMIDTSDLSTFRNLAAKWQAKGTRILLINFPIEASEELKKWKGADTSKFNLNLNYLRQQVFAVYYNPQLKLDTSYFYDFTHMNQKGSAIFSQFFCKELAHQLSSL